ncbi:hypothetical protein [Rhizobium sp. IMFF44]|uniref:hypothetical protein n=1 Tax=Rhizobium sp. IMFF44 TaxID=3342350 RepID=UPI0035B7E8B2
MAAPCNGKDLTRSLEDNTLIVISGEPYGSAIATKVNWSINQIHRRVAVLKANSLPL